MDTHRNRRPRLLVSVRDAREAREAIRAGSDVVDVKEPERGSLGMADVDQVRAIAEVFDATAGESHSSQNGRNGENIALSVALGETVEWKENDSLPALPEAVQFAKLGTAGLGDDREWQHRWERTRQQFEAAAGRSLEWVAVAYADWDEAKSPHPSEIVKAASHSGCRVLLIDTHTKNGRDLFAWSTFDALMQIRNEAQAAGMQFALAGGLHQGILEQAVRLDPEIVGIRTAACRGGRTGRACAEEIGKFKTALRAAVEARTSRSAVATDAD